MFEIISHPKVVSDLKHLSKREKETFFRIIDNKLSIDPVSCSKPLKNSLKNHRSVRFGKYRIVFRVIKKQVYVLAVGHRNDIYDGVRKRV